MESLTTSTTNDIRDIKRCIENGESLHVPPGEFLSMKQNILFLSSSLEELQQLVIRVFNTVATSGSSNDMPTTIESSTSGHVVDTYDNDSNPIEPSGSTHVLTTPTECHTSGHIVDSHDSNPELQGEALASTKHAKQ